MRLKNWPWWRNNPINLQQTRYQLQEKLTQAGCESPANTSLILLQHALNHHKSWLLSHGEYKLSPQENNTLQTDLKALLQGVPLPYILGHWDFYGRTFQVTPDVLIPRPETELLVESALHHAQRFHRPVIIDVGTGSGAIAVSLAIELPSALVLGLDLSMAALQVAQNNAQRWCPNRISFLQSDLLMPFLSEFDLICANLPYIPHQDLAKLEVSKWEPTLALDGGASGLEPIRRLLTQAQARLSPSGVILLETEASLGAVTLAEAQAAFPNAAHRLRPDLTGHDRIVEICQI